MDPATLALVSLGTTVAGGVVSAVGAQQSAQAQSAAAGYNAQIASRNAELAASEGEAKVGQSLQKTRALVGATLAEQGASGVDINSGSSTNVRASEAVIGKQDALTIRANAAKEAYGYLAQSNLNKAEAENAKKAGNISAFADVLGGVGSASSSYSRYLLSSGGLNTNSET